MALKSLQLEGKSIKELEQSTRERINKVYDNAIILLVISGILTPIFLALKMIEILLAFYLFMIVGVMIIWGAVIIEVLYLLLLTETAKTGYIEGIYKTLRGVEEIEKEEK